MNYKQEVLKVYPDAECRKILDNGKVELITPRSGKTITVNATDLYHTRQNTEMLCQR